MLCLFKMIPFGYTLSLFMNFSIRKLNTFLYFLRKKIFTFVPYSSPLKLFSKSNNKVSQTMFSLLISSEKIEVSKSIFSFFLVDGSCIIRPSVMVSFILGIWFLPITFEAQARNGNFFTEYFPPFDIGVDTNLGLTRARDAIVLNRKFFNEPLYCNAFACLVGIAPGEEKIPRDKDNPRPDIVMPMLATLGITLNTNFLISGRTVWKTFRGYPYIGIDIIYRRYSPMFNDMLDVYIGNFIGGGLSLEIYKHYWSQYAFFPKIGIAVGFFEAPVSNSKHNKKLSNLIKSYRTKPLGKNATTIRYKGINTMLYFGTGWRYRVNLSWIFKIKLMYEYMFSFALGQRYLIYQNKNAENTKIVKKPKNKPSQKHSFFSGLVLCSGISYSATEPAVRYFRYDKNKDCNSLELGCLMFGRRLNIMSYNEYKSLILVPNNEKIKNLGIDSVFYGFGIYGYYTFKSDWLRVNISNLIFDTFSLIIGAEATLIDGATKAKARQMKQAIDNTSRITLLAGFGFNDFNLVKLRLLIGYDFVQFDNWSLDKREAFISSTFLSPELQFCFLDSYCITLYTKIRPMKNISYSGRGGLFKKISRYDSLFYDVGVKFAYAFS